MWSLSDSEGIKNKNEYDFKAYRKTGLKGFFSRKPDNAAGQLGRLEEHIVGLEKFPERFRHYEKEPWCDRGLRVMPVDNYLVFYIPDKNVGIVTIIRVMYAGRDVDSQLGGHE